MTNDDNNFTIYHIKLTYVLGTFRIDECLMKIAQTVQLPRIPLKNMMENTIGTKYVSILAEYGIYSNSVEFVTLSTMETSILLSTHNLQMTCLLTTVHQY